MVYFRVAEPEKGERAPPARKVYRDLEA
eukprot:SAG22_NODE_22586_length_195_cov_23.072917_2_plen_27_part_01